MSDMSALYTAIHNNETAKVLSAIDAGADVNARSGELGMTLLIASANKMSCAGVELLQGLIDRGAEVNATTPFVFHPAVLGGGHGLAALHWAAANDHLAAVNALVAAGADFDVIDSKGKTPLHHAAKEGCARAKALVGFGARRDVADELGMTPLERAQHLAEMDAENPEVVATMAALRS